MRKHPTVHQIRQLLSSPVSWDGDSAAHHLLQCERCRRLALDHLTEPEAENPPETDLLAKILPYRRADAGEPPGEPAPDAAGEPGEPSASFYLRLRARMAAAASEVAGNAELLDELVRCDLERWPMLFDNDSRFRSLALAIEIVEHSVAVSYQDPLRAVRIARLALDLLDRLGVEGYGEQLLDEVRARAWTRIGTGYRVAGELTAADAAFGVAETLLDGSADPRERASFLYLRGLLQKDQRRFDEALGMFDVARSLSAEIEDQDLILRVLISTGSLHMERGHPEEALPELLDAIAQLDERTDRRVALFARSNLASCLVELGDYRGAREMFDACRDEYATSQDSFVRLRAQWMEGRIESGLGDVERAESSLKAAREGYLEGGQHYNAALVSLHLAAVYARTGRAADLRELAENMAAVFVAQDIPAEAMAALAFFRQAVEQERASEQLVGGVAGFLQRAQADPALKFHGV